ncbi:hypothetical protein F4780DRAFT_779841 [Xylariomycetidae sp. FL0641]|nr:hypothetical protein F4780DRAFT_779841 [Xylariomycetidae sp. FL0641]
MSDSLPLGVVRSEPAVSVREVKNIASGCYGWSWQDWTLNRKPTSGDVFIQHFKGCRCPKSLCIACIIDFFHEGLRTDYHNFAHLVLHTKLGLLFWGEIRSCRRGTCENHAGLGGSHAKTQVYRGLRLDEYEKPAMGIWTAILLPVAPSDEERVERHRKKTAWRLTGEDCPDPTDTRYSPLEGDMVFIDANRKVANMEMKLFPQDLKYPETWLGPFTVLQVLQNSCRLDGAEKEGIFPVVHKSLLRQIYRAVHESPDEAVATGHVCDVGRQGTEDGERKRRLSRGSQRPKILDVVMASEFYFILEGEGEARRWIHSSYMEDEWDSLDEFYASHPNHLKPLFYQDYLESVGEASW